MSSRTYIQTLIFLTPTLQPSATVLLCLGELKKESYVLTLYRAWTGQLLCSVNIVGFVEHVGSVSLLWCCAAKLEVVHKHTAWLCSNIPLLTNPGWLHLTTLCQSLIEKKASLVAQLVKESTCSARDLGSIPGLGRSPGGGHGYPLQYSWRSLPGFWRIPMDRRAWWATGHKVTKTWTQLSDKAHNIGEPR